MPHSATLIKRSRRSSKKPVKNHKSKVESRYTVGLAPSLADQVQRYAETVDTSMSKAIAALVRFGLESQENRKPPSIPFQLAAIFRSRARVLANLGMPILGVR